MATKAIIWARVSTIEQEIADQIKDLEKMAKADGYTDNEVKIISRKGASAIKIDDVNFKEEIDELYATINENPTIEVVYVWEVSRIVRSDEPTFYTLKHYLTSRKIQFVCREPYFKLLNSNGVIDSGAEIILNTMATLSKQEMDVKKARFKRAKKAMAAIGKFAGGRVRFGYSVDDNGMLVINDDEADVIRIIYQLYLQQDASVNTVWQEVKSRGVNILNRSVRRILKDTAYIGYVVHTNHRIYPQIIDNETYNAVQTKMKGMYKEAVKTPNYYLGNKILRCLQCGHGYKVTGRQYLCWAHSPNNRDGEKCTNTNMIDVKWFDSILWDFVWTLEVEWRLNKALTNADEYRAQIAVLEQKIDAQNKIITGIGGKIDRLGDRYVDGDISKEQWKQKTANLKAEAAEAQQQIAKYTNDIENLNILITGTITTTEEIGKTITSVAESVKNLTYKEMHEICRRHIAFATIEASEFEGKKAKTIRIYPRVGGEKVYYYRTHVNAKAADQTRVYTDDIDPETNKHLAADIYMIR